MNVKLGDTIYVGFSTANPNTGAVQAADFLPVVNMYAAGALMGYLPTVTSVGPGRYQAQVVFSTGNGFVDGTQYRADVTASVLGQQGADSIGLFQVQAATLDDLNTLVILANKLLRNKFITDPATGIATLYDDDSTTVLLSGFLYENATATQLYRGQGAERRERLA